MTDARRRRTWLIVGVVALLVGAAVVVTQIVPYLRRDSIELCSREFHRSGSVWTDQRVQALGGIHRVGTSRVDESLWTVTSAWPEGRCDGVTPTVLFSRDGGAWRTWPLVGGP